MILDILRIVQDEWITLILLLVVAIVGYYYWMVPSNLPPGPIGFPFIGSIVEILKDYPERSLARLSQKYGNVMSLYLGNQLVVVLGDYPAINEAFVKQAEIFSGRPQSNAIKVFDDDKGILIEDGEVWKVHRRFALSTLKDFGVGKNSLEPAILEEFQMTVKEMEGFKGKPFNPSKIIGRNVANIIAALEFGKRFEYDDPDFILLKDTLEENIKYVGSLALRAFFPWLKYIPFMSVVLKENKIKDAALTARRIFNKKIEDHTNTLSSDGNSNDFADAYLNERKRIIDKTGNEGFFDLAELRDILGALFAAGAETTLTTTLWGLIFMMKYPEIQSRVQEEIDNIIGHERLPSMKDRPNMPYTEAVLLEIQRKGSIVPLNLVHSNTEETTLFGYTIPKRSYIISNLWYVHHDPKYWKQPQEFRPERFLNDNGQVTKPEYLIPFSVGKRSCLGESLARMELFLLFVTLLRRFTFTAANESSISEEFDSGITRIPKPFEVIALERQLQD